MNERDMIKYGFESGFIYVVEMEGQGIYKIGRTTDVQKRLTQFGIQPPFRYRLRFAHRVDCQERVERFLHVIYKAQRLNGEWFRLSEHQLAEIEAELLVFQCRWLMERLTEQIKDFSFLMEPRRVDRFGSVLSKVLHRYARRSWCLWQLQEKASIRSAVDSDGILDAEVIC